MTGTKGDNVTDYETKIDLDKALYASGITHYSVDVQTSYTFGPPMIMEMDQTVKNVTPLQALDSIMAVRQPIYKLIFG